MRRLRFAKQQDRSLEEFSFYNAVQCNPRFENSLSEVSTSYNVDADVWKKLRKFAFRVTETQLRPEKLSLGDALLSHFQLRTKQLSLRRDCSAPAAGSETRRYLRALPPPPSLGVCFIPRFYSRLSTVITQCQA